MPHLAIAGAIPVSGSPDSITGLIERYSYQYGADDLVMKNIAYVESGFNPKAKNPNSTATGLFQIVIGTWKAFKCEGNRENAEDNIKCAIRIATTSGYQHWGTSARMNGKGWLFLPYKYNESTAEDV